MTISEVERRVVAQLAGSLPGLQAQRLMAPRPRPGWQPAGSPPQRRTAAALVLCFPGSSGAAVTNASRVMPSGTPVLCFPGSSGAAVALTVRSEALAHHGGQVSLPGGAVASGEPIEEAALREAHEEIGVEPGRVRVLGALTPIDIPISGYWLHPFVAVTGEQPPFSPAVSEVTRVIEAPVARLLSPASLGFDRRLRDGVHYDVPFFRIDGDIIWGATAMILAEFLWLLGWRPPASVPLP